MTREEAIKWVDITRMMYICDPNECGLEKGKEPCPSFHCDDIHNALDMAIEALEKQIPKKPLKYTTSFPGCGMVSECPVCGLQFGFNRGFNFCEDCGQAIDWTEDAE